MTQPLKRPAAHLEVVPATLEQAPILKNLLELYSHDFSEFQELWSRPLRMALLLRGVSFRGITTCPKFVLFSSAAL
jgi:hypothetical protein